jgi:CHASE2 domain-containing sensor protein
MKTHLRSYHHYRAQASRHLLLAVGYLMVSLAFTASWIALTVALCGWLSLASFLIAFVCGTGFGSQLSKYFSARRKLSIFYPPIS